jgi:hypothetical protein
MKCPHCGRHNPALTNPVRGRLAICIHCAGFSVVAPWLELVPTTKEFLSAALAPDDYQDVLAQRRAIAALISAPMRN